MAEFAARGIPNPRPRQVENRAGEIYTEKLEVELLRLGAAIARKGYSRAYNCHGLTFFNRMKWFQESVEAELLKQG